MKYDVANRLIWLKGQIINVNNCMSADNDYCVMK